MNTEESGKPRLYSVELRRTVLVLAPTEDAAWAVADALAIVDPNDLHPEESCDLHDEGPSVARMGAENGKRVRQLIPHRAGAREVRTVGALIEAGEIDVSEAE